MLAAGLEGIEKKMIPPPPVEENIFEFTPEEAKERKIGVLSKDLFDAITNLSNDELMRKTLGEYTFEKLWTLKNAEWDSFRMQVSGWEIDEYIEKY